MKVVIHILIKYLYIYECFQRRHPSKLQAFSDCVATRKRTLEPPKTTTKQAKLDDMMAAGASRHVPQVKVDKLVISFICDGLHPFSVVEQPAFKELIIMLNPQCNVISRPTLWTRIEEAANQMKKNLMSHLSKVSYVGTTTDCWTAHQQSF